MNRAVQIRGAGSKQRAAQQCQGSNREPELCFLFQRSGLKFSGTAAVRWDILTYGVKPSNQILPWSHYRRTKIHTPNGWLLLVTRPIRNA